MSDGSPDEARGVAGPVVVTGASGFIGSRLVERLTASGTEVHAVSRRRSGGDRIVRWWQVDLSNLSSVRSMVEAIRPNAIVHLASHVSGKPSLEFVSTTLTNNLVATVNVLTAAVESDCRRVVVTGTMVEPDDRSGVALAGSPYAMSKWASSAYARMFHALYALPVVILRVFMVYGPGQGDVTKLIPHTILSLLKGESPAVSRGRWEVDWVYVDDVVEAYVAALRADGVEGETFDVGSGSLVSMRDMLNKIAELIGSGAWPAFGAMPDRPLELPRRADVERTATMLGWASTTPLEAGLAATIDWYRREHAGSRPAEHR